MSSFPLYRILMRGDVAISASGSKDVLDAITYWFSTSPPTMFGIQNVFDYVPKPPQFLDTRPFEEGGIPSIPPFSSCWSEFVAWNGARFAVWVGLLPSRWGTRDNWMSLVFTDNMGPDGGVIILPADYSLEFDEDGVLALGGDGAVMRHEGCSDDIYDVMREGIVTTTIVALTAFMFCHCKNVDLVERLPKRHEQREAKRRGEPILKYHEIVIDPNRSYATNESSRNVNTAPSKSLHLVRGHFAHYSEDRPLFGKYTGTFWVPAHVRGSAEVGTVKSTYRVKARAA